MRRYESEYPIGATWKFVDIVSGKTGSVWLAERNKNFEIWRWSVQYSDGSGAGFDWAMSKPAAVSHCSGKFRGKTRFVRVKN